MLGQAHTPRRRLLPFAAVALAVLIAPAVGGANPSHSVSSLRAHDAAIAAKSRVGRPRPLLARPAARTARTRGSRRCSRSARRCAPSARRSPQLRDRAAQHRGSRERALGRQIRALYEQGNVEPLEILFGAKSLDEALTSLDNLSRSLRAQGEDVLAQLKAAKARLAAASRGARDA